MYAQPVICPAALTEVVDGVAVNNHEGLVVGGGVKLDLQGVGGRARERVGGWVPVGGRARERRVGGEDGRVDVERVPQAAARYWCPPPAPRDSGSARAGFAHAAAQRHSCTTAALAAKQEANVLPAPTCTAWPRFKTRRLRAVPNFRFAVRWGARSAEAAAAAGGRGGREGGQKGAGSARGGCGSGW